MVDWAETLKQHKPQGTRSDKDLPHLQCLPAGVSLAVSAFPQEAPFVVPLCVEEPLMV